MVGVMKKSLNLGWARGWQGEEREYPLFIDVNDTSISFKVAPLVHLDLDWLQWPELSLFLLELNSESQLVKASVNEQGEIVLSSYCLTEGLNYDGFSKMLGILGYYCDAFYGEIISCLEVCGYQNHNQSTLLI